MNSINMKNILVIGGLLTAMVVNGGETPKGWFAAGNRPRDYEMSTDHAAPSTAAARERIGEVHRSKGGRFWHF